MKFGDIKIYHKLMLNNKRDKEVVNLHQQLPPLWVHFITFCKTLYAALHKLNVYAPQVYVFTT